MATERRLALLTLAAALAGCTTVNPCASDTILVSVSLDSTSAAADTLQVDITVDGTTRNNTLPHAIGDSSGTIEVRFPSGYPTGKKVGVSVVARKGGQVIGSGEVSPTLPPSCANVVVSVTGTTVGGGDGTTPDDLTFVPPDLVGADLFNCAAQPESCFNGIDDNCDGLIDCADPQCTGGSTPVAECVPDPGSNVAGTLSATVCPTTYPTAAPLFAGLMPGSCGAGTCACGNGVNGTPTCSTRMDKQGTNQLSCNIVGTNQWSASNTLGCFSFPAVSLSTYYTLFATTLNATCNPPTGGASVKSPPTWTSTSNLCSGSAVGRGCQSGQICVPAAPNHCVVKAGSQVACDVPGYAVQNTTPFFSGFDDTQRNCGCSCKLSGSCGATIMGVGNCPLVAFSPGCQTFSNNYDHGQVGSPSNVACGPSATSSGTTTTAGFERTVCCTK